MKSPNLGQSAVFILILSYYLIHEGTNLGYVPLPAAVVKHNQDALKSLTFKSTLHVAQ